MNIEDTRGWHVGDSVARLGPNDLVAAAFHHHANQAHWHTINCLLRLGGASVDGHADELIGIVEYWRMIESLVALLYAVVLRESATGLRPAIERVKNTETPDAISKWSAIARWFSENRDSAPSEVTGRLTDLRDFRNAFEHSSRSDSRARHHSKLPALPTEANVADTMEALAICIASCAYLRSALPGCDLMPQVIVIPHDGSVFFESMDVVAQQLTFPMYHAALESRGLSTEVALYEEPHPMRGKAVLPVNFMIRYKDEHPLPEPSDPNGLVEMLRGFSDNHPRKPGPDHFGIPSYSKPLQP